jgi:DNA-directed RNA polymerase specialized sigma24 family protein
MAGDGFDSTHWSAVLRAAGSSPAARDALSKLCEAYWFPLYAYLRRRYPPDQAQDLTQEFFAREVITRRIFKGVDPLNGRFRAWLMASLQHVVANIADAAAAQKRGGRAAHLSIDGPAAEARYLDAANDALTPEQLYERSWALTVLDRVRAQLGARYEADGDGELFRALEGTLPGPARARPYADIARALGKTEGDVKVRVHRLRKDFGDLLREEVRRTVSGADEVDPELRHLLGIFE